MNTKDVAIMKAVAVVVREYVSQAGHDIAARLKALEARLGVLPTVELAIGDLRDRVVTVETKAAMPAPVLPDVVGVLAPVQERIAILEERLSALRSEVDSDDTRHEVHEAALQRDGGAINDRLVAVETKIAAPMMPPVDLEHEAAVVDLRSRVSGLEARTHTDISSADIASVRERLAVLETRAPVPGPAGAQGLNGNDGRDGTLDGNIKIVRLDERTVSLCFKNGDPIEGGIVKFDVPLYRGVYVNGKAYEASDMVTWAGSTWYAREATTDKPGDGSTAWVLTVKRGRDGRDGVDAPGAMPVVSVGKPR